MAAHATLVHCSVAISPQCLAAIAAMAHTPTNANSRMLRVKIMIKFNTPATLIITTVHCTSVRPMDH